MWRAQHLRQVFYLLTFKSLLVFKQFFSFFVHLQLKKIIALFCLLVLCIQVLPIKQIGAVLFNNQITEELAHSSDCGPKKQASLNESDHYLPANLSYALPESQCSNNHSIFAHFPLIQLHFAEVQTPPPNLM
jgi:hypothetical protein